MPISKKRPDDLHSNMDRLKSEIALLSKEKDVDNLHSNMDRLKLIHERTNGERWIRFTFQYG